MTVKISILTGETRHQKYSINVLLLLHDVDDFVIFSRWEYQVYVFSNDICWTQITLYLNADQCRDENHASLRVKARHVLEMKFSVICLEKSCDISQHYTIFTIRVFIIMWDLCPNLKSSHSSMGTGWASTWQMEVELGTGGERSGGGSGCGKGNGWDGRRKGARRVTLDGWTTIWTSWSDHEPKVESCGTKSNPIDLFCEQSSETDQSTLVSGSLIPFVWSLRRYRR